MAGKEEVRAEKSVGDYGAEVADRVGRKGPQVRERHKHRTDEHEDAQAVKNKRRAFWVEQAQREYKRDKCKHAVDKKVDDIVHGDIGENYVRHAAARVRIGKIYRVRKNDKIANGERDCRNERLNPAMFFNKMRVVPVKDLAVRMCVAKKTLGCTGRHNYTP